MPVHIITECLNRTILPAAHHIDGPDDPSLQLRKGFQFVRESDPGLGLRSELFGRMD